ncbi:hypothetical protein EYF80_027109 [Liparis tanakae]|uniref:Uncharacterized protein n=1 Tax=Liparis tanakae TaxID=230148 RepID=A0A4Z2H9W0_9TELE|nr:hypothetical protein EYF80_027109 [Liparis tanakae]
MQQSLNGCPNQNLADITEGAHEECSGKSAWSNSSTVSTIVQGATDSDGLLVLRGQAKTGKPVGSWNDRVSEREDGWISGWVAVVGLQREIVEKETAKDNYFSRRRSHVATADRHSFPQLSPPYKAWVTEQSNSWFPGSRLVRWEFEPGREGKNKPPVVMWARGLLRWKAKALWGDECMEEDYV